MLLRALILLLFASVPTTASAQLIPSTTPRQPAAPVDPFARETPRSTVTGLIDALAARDYARAANYLDLPVQQDDRVAAGAAELTRRLQGMLDRGGELTPFAALSNDAAGRIDDDLPADQENVGTFGKAEGGTPIVLTRGPGPSGAQIWRVSQDTIRTLRSRRAATARPESAQHGIAGTSVAGAPLHDWALLLLIAAVSFVALRALAAAILTVMRRSIRDHEHSSVYGFTSAALPPLSLYLSVVAFYIYANNMPVAIVARQTLLRYAGGVAWVALAWFLLRLVDAIARVAAGRMRRAERRQAVSVITLLRRSAKIVLLAIAVIAVLDTFGLDVTTGIAALGIGGIALALGAQKTVENLVGSVTVIVDQPVQVGDFCKVGDVVGTVEDIGMRSTRIRHERADDCYDSQTAISLHCRSRISRNATGFCSIRRLG